MMPRRKRRGRWRDLRPDFRASVRGVRQTFILRGTPKCRYGATPTR
jgi:hypothetical protein